MIANTYSDVINIFSLSFAFGGWTNSAESLQSWINIKFKLNFIKATTKNCEFEKFIYKNIIKFFPDSYEKVLGFLALVSWQGFMSSFQPAVVNSHSAICRITAHAKMPGWFWAIHYFFWSILWYVWNVIETHNTSRPYSLSINTIFSV